MITVKQLQEHLEKYWKPIPVETEEEKYWKSWITEKYKMDKKNNEIRIFESGSIRDTSSGKVEYLGFMHPVIDKSFADYMHQHRKMNDGSMRESNNWWGGFGSDVCVQSMSRHLEDLKALHLGYIVYEERHNNEVYKHYLNSEDQLSEVITTDNSDNLIKITIEDCLNAIRFNSGAMMIEELGINEL